MDEEQEFHEDFGAPAITDAELDELLAKARATGDPNLRRLVKRYRGLRHIAEMLLQRVEQAASDGDQLLKVARFMVRGEGGIGSA